MIIIHIESGLGNQMLSYCEYLALKKVNPNEEFYLENIIYDIPECNEVICQWNGYELEHIFGIKEPNNLRTLFSEKEWNDILHEIRSSKFWLHNWNYPVYFTKILNRHGLNLENVRGDFEDGRHYAKTDIERKKSLRTRFVDTWPGATAKRYYRRLFKKEYLNKVDFRAMLFAKYEKNVFTGQWLAFKFQGNERWRIDDDIQKSFVFPPLEDERNMNFVKMLDGCNSIAIHARRGDMLSVNGWCYKYGYFRRAVNYVRKHVKNPVFVFFTNRGSIDWCRENADIFGLDYHIDEVLFVDWNTGATSYRDMQLMSHCKHAIITNSSFGWWGAYFIKNPCKITISPDIVIDSTNHI